MSTLWVPQFDGLLIVLAARYDEALLRVPVYALHISTMPTEDLLLGASVKVPHPQGAVVAAGGKLIVGRTETELRILPILITSESQGESRFIYHVHMVLLSTQDPVNLFTLFIETLLIQASFDVAVEMKPVALFGYQSDFIHGPFGLHITFGSVSLSLVSQQLVRFYLFGQLSWNWLLFSL